MNQLVKLWNRIEHRKAASVPDGIMVEDVYVSMESSASDKQPVRDEASPRGEVEENDRSGSTT